MKRYFLITFLMSGLAGSWEQPQTLKLLNGVKCNVYSDRVLKISPMTPDDPDGLMGTHIEVLKFSPNAKPEAICKSSQPVVRIANRDGDFRGYSDAWIFMSSTQSAPGTSQLWVYSAVSGKEAYSLFTHDFPYEVSKSKLIFFDALKDLENVKCPQTVGAGCIQVEKTELDLKSGKKTRLGQTEFVVNQ